MLKQRIITAVILALIVVGTIFLLEPVYVSVLFAVMMLLSVTELVNMTISRAAAVQWSLAVLMVGLFYLALPLMDIRFLFYHSYLGLLLWLAILVYLIRYRFSGSWGLTTRGLAWAISMLLIWICIHGLLFIHQHFVQGSWMLMYLLTLVWVADIGAYFSGKRFGRHKLAPTISPGKTWEGVIGGILLNCLWISLVYLLSAGWGMHYLAFLLLGLVTASLSVVGDLYISLLKREAGLKDSGKILPGHGGILDRIDSLIAATPVFISGLYLLGAV
ncbi:MAG: phosphatidate cytidylyltransferase [Gammaproteobacteria bacterium]|nr:phosphatidate cytidylyltransferase [Gammaproteobacteria bacterium]